jgi:hypothetical protein
MKSIYPTWRVRAIHWLAKALGVLVHIEGRPFGSNRIYVRNPAGAAHTGRGNAGGGLTGSTVGQ